MKLTWRGETVKQHVQGATLAAIDECTEAAAQDAQGSHWWKALHGRSGLEGHIIAEPAKVRPGGHRVGRFGSSLRREGFYGLFHERRRPFLRPAADRNFPKLGRAIRHKLISRIF